MKRAIFLAAVFAAIASSQSQTAQIVGTITDASGAAVVGTSISAINTATAVKRDTTSNQVGNYAIPMLPPGSYQITVNHKGFRPITRPGVDLEVSQVARMDFRLEPGDVNVEITVTAEAPLLAQDTSSLGQVVDEAKIANIPLNGRSPFRLVQLTPGVLSAPSASGQFGDIPVNTTWDANFSINGGRHQSNEVLIDGVPATAGFFNQMTTIPTVEAAQEFKVESNNLSAEYGRFGGGVINVSTKAGSNKWHGSALEFIRNNAFDANEFFNKTAGKSIPPFRMNQFGGSLAGPLSLPKLYSGKNRTFFFADYQGTHWRRGDVFTATMPTALEKAGDFTKTFNSAGQMMVVYDPSTTRPDPNVTGQSIRDPFPGNVIPANRVDPIAKNMVTYYPSPNTAGDPVSGLNNFVSNAKRIIDQNQFSGRVDHNVGDRYRTFIRVAGNNTNLTQPDYYDNVATPGTGAVGTTPFRQRSVAWNHTYTATPTLLLDVRYGYARWYQIRGTRSYGFDSTTLGYPASLVQQFQVPTFPVVSVDTYGGLGGSSYTVTANDSHSLLASVSKYAGRHNLKAGLDLRLRKLNLFDNGGANGSYSFTRAYTRGPNPNTVYANSGVGLASLLLGTPASGSVPINVAVAMQNWYAAGYIQDDIRLARNLTLNIGLRYETETPLVERHNQLMTFDSSLSSPAKNSQFPNLAGGLLFAGVGNYPRSVYTQDKNNFAPRIGIAWALAPRTVFRSGAGLFYAPLEVSNNAVGYSPSLGFSATTPMVASLDGITPFRYLNNPFPDGIQKPSGSSLGASTYLGQSVNFWDPQARTPYVLQWNASLQREIGHGIVIEAAYSGSHGIKLTRARDMNYLDPQYLSLGTKLQSLVSNPFYGTITTGTLAQKTVAQRQLLLPFPQFTGVTAINSTSGNSIYHALNLKLQQRFKSGFTFLVAYTAGKLISDTNNQLAPIGAVNNGSSVQDWENLHLERAVSEMDVSQQLAVSAVYELPFGPNKRFFSSAHGIGAALIGGWQLNGVATRRTGFPLALSASISGGGNRPTSTGTSASLDQSSRSRDQQITQWFDTAQFILPAAYSLGNVSRTLPDVRGPGMTNLDMSMFKNQKIHERLTAQLRFEYFNVFNTPFLWTPNTSMGSLQFGKITSTTGLPRVGQIGLKLVF
jgi:hypothetical protein